MTKHTRYMVLIAQVVATGGFLMGFDVSVISGVLGFVEAEFSLTKIQVGWAASCLSLTAVFGMMVSGPLSDRLGRRPVLKIAAVLFAVSAITSAIAPTFTFFIVARMLGGLSVGAALIVAPMYIAEIAPSALRGRLVSFNQLNIVVGISVAFFSNYMILRLGASGADWVQALSIDEATWRWMLAIEGLPAVLYLFALMLVPESPRWLMMNAKEDDARKVLQNVGDAEHVQSELVAIRKSIAEAAAMAKVTIGALLSPSLRLVLTIGITVGVLQQITGINSVFFYAPMIFEQSGIGADASFMQAILVGLVNLVFTVVAMLLIDKIGRRLLLGVGLVGIAVCMLTLAYTFGAATYTLDQAALASLPAQLDVQVLSALQDVTFNSDVEFRLALYELIGADTYGAHESALISASITSNPMLILFAILGFVASFAVSLGPVMWVLFSELFPNRVRGLAISFVGLINSATSFVVTMIFPWELEAIGAATTFLLYGIFAIVGLILVLRILPETKGRSLEELEAQLVGSGHNA